VFEIESAFPDARGDGRGVSLNEQVRDEDSRAKTELGDLGAHRKQVVLQILLMLAANIWGGRWGVVRMLVLPRYSGGAHAASLAAMPLASLTPLRHCENRERNTDRSPGTFCYE
jgi:hypothetical protein